jgi:hypothetical protein
VQHTATRSSNYRRASTRRADGDVPRVIGAPLIDELKPMIIPLVAVLRAWQKISSHADLWGQRAMIGRFRYILTNAFTVEDL